MRERTIPVTAAERAGGDCVDVLLQTLTGHKGIGGVSFDPARRAVSIRYDPAVVSLQTVERLADRAGVELGERYGRCSFRLDGVGCRTCGRRIEERLERGGEIAWASANPASGGLTLEYVGTPGALPRVSREVGLGPAAGSSAPTTPPDEEAERWWDEHGQLALAAVTGLLLLTAFGLGAAGVIGHRVQIGLYVLTYLAGGTLATRSAIEALLGGSVDVDLLMVVAAIGAATIGGWAEGGLLLFLFSLGNGLEHLALGRTHRAVRALMALSPEDALVVRDGREERLPVAALVVGDEVVVRPAERIPVDARVLSGESAVDQAPITGESMPVGKRAGDPVFAGTINGGGLLRLAVERPAQESTLAKIIRVVEEARNQKSRTQRFTDRFEGAYAIGVIAASALVFSVPTLLFGQPFQAMFYRAMTLLVVASPCALVISTPASILSALANGARRGILFKGAVHLENTGALDAVAFDKTGTLTLGQPRVTDVVPYEGVDDSTLLRLAAAAERRSEHPLGLAVVREAEARGLGEEIEVIDLQSVAGRGIRALVEGQVLHIGNDALFVAEGIALPQALRAAADRLRAEGKTTMYVVAGGRPLGVIGVADVIRPIAPAVIAELHRLGVRKTILLTGDNERAARAIAGEVGIDEWRAELLPEQKLDVIRALQASGLRVAMVGDGVNDAPALATADVGIAMGAAGTDVALETADVVLMSDDLTRLPYAVELSRTARRIIWQNMAFALGVIALFSLGAVLGIVPLPLGVVAHEGGTILVVSNGLRLLRFARPALAS